MTRITFLGKNLEFGTFSIPLTVFWIVFLINATNLIDGLDGLSCGVSAISACSMLLASFFVDEATLTVILMTGILAGSCIGFLPFNFNPAKIFMGDSGSELLGFSIAAVSILGTVKSATIVVVIIPALVLGLPIFDTVMAIFRRLAKHQSIGTADKEHLHHRIMKAGFGQKRAVMILYCISGIMGIVAVLYSRGLTVEYLGLTAVAIMLIYVLLSDTGNRNISLKADKIKKERPDKKEEKNKQDKHIEKGSDNK